MYSKRMSEYNQCVLTVHTWSIYDGIGMACSVGCDRLYSELYGLTTFWVVSDGEDYVGCFILILSLYGHGYT